MRTNELMLYKNMEHGRILKNMTFLMENCGNDYYNREDLRSLLFECMNEILEISASHGFEGNLWHTYLTFLLVNDENAYSTSCEIVGEIDGSFMTFRYLKNCLIMIFRRWSVNFRQNVCRFFLNIKIRAMRGRFLTGVFGIVSVIWQKDLQIRRTQ